MCGIVAYVDHQQAVPIIINGLKRLEYRGYDSAGISLINGGLNVYKKKRLNIKGSAKLMIKIDI